MKRKKLVLFPFNGNALEALDCINHSQFEMIGYVDDNPDKVSVDYPIHSRKILSNNDVFVLAVPGSPVSFKDRKRAIDSLNVPINRFISVIHPSANIGRNVKIGVNVLIMPGVVLTSTAIVGDHVCILPNSVVHHDSSIGDYTLIGSNVVIAGGTNIGNNCYVGSGTNIINGITVGDFALIGLGSNVVKNVDTNSIIAGNPAKPITAK